MGLFYRLSFMKDCVQDVHLSVSKWQNFIISTMMQIWSSFVAHDSLEIDNMLFM